MNSLVTRLFAAFLLIILVVILIVGFALSVILRNSPLIERQTLARLNTAARQAFLQNPPPPNLTPPQSQRYVSDLSNALDVRVLLIEQSGQIIADARPEKNVALELNLAAARPDPAIPGTLNGSASATNRRQWDYVTRPLGPARLLVFAAQRPRFPGFAFFVDNLFWPLLEAGGVAALVAAVLAVLITSSIATPLQKMSTVAQGIARGDYALSAPVTGPDEVRALGQSLNAMSQQVQATQRAQRDFLANVSHELKTPLTSIQGFAQAILDGAAASPASLKRAADIIYTEAERMRRLVENLLDIARLDAGLRALHRAPLDLHLILTTTVDKFSLRTQEQGVTLVTTLPPSLPAMIGDADRLAQVFTNLLDNALKHTPAGGTVTLGASPTPGGVEISVTDTGPGIPPEDLSRIFERFYQVDKSRAKPGGLGLGLAISKDIVEAHHGGLSVESVVGQGTRFVVRLPRALPSDTTMAQKRN